MIHAVLEFELGCVFFEILLYDRFVLFDRGIFKFTEVAFGLFYAVEEGEFCFIGLFIITAETFQEFYSFQNLIS